MYDLLLKGGRLIDPVNHIDGTFDIACADGVVVEVAEEINESVARKTLDATGKTVMPGIIDMHTHMRTVLGHPHAQRMVALAGVTTTLDMAGPLDNILDSIPTSGAGINIAVLEAARFPQTISSNRPDACQRMSLIEQTLERGGIGIKLLGGHFPMDLDICEGFIDQCNEARAWIGWHAGNSENGSNIEGFRDAVRAAEGKFLHIAHVNSYCRSQISNEVDEALEAIELLKANPNIFSESYLSPLNGTRLTIGDDGAPASKVTVTCLKKKGYTPDLEGMKQAILDGWVGVLCDNGVIGELKTGAEALDYWIEHKTVTVGSFAVNPAASRFLLAQAKRNDGSFVVDSFSTDGGSYPRNVIVENGLPLVRFGALSMRDFVVKASVNGARALGLPQKGHLGVGADADITVLDTEKMKAYAGIVAGNVIMLDGKLCGKGTTIICDERGEGYLKSRGIACCIKKPLDQTAISARFVP